jgi:hypothetical protein
MPAPFVCLIVIMVSVAGFSFNSALAQSKKQVCSLFAVHRPMPTKRRRSEKGSRRPRLPWVL